MIARLLILMWLLNAHALIVESGAVLSVLILIVATDVVEAPVIAHDECELQMSFV